MIFWILLGMIPIAMLVGTVAWWKDKGLVYGAIVGPLIVGGFVLLLVGTISAAGCKQVYGVLYEAEIASIKTDERISRLRGKFHPFTKGVKLLAIYHPAALLRNPGYKRAVWEDMKLLKKEYEKL